MMLRALLAVLLTAAPAYAQQPGPAVDVSRLPIDLDRIQRELRESQIKEEREGLNLRYQIDVYGQAPPIVLIDPSFDLVNGPVPNSAPTHRDMIEHVTPQEHRAPAADLSALFRWLADKTRR
jgi:hypothetical protein